MQCKAGHRPILLRVSPRSTMAKHSEWVTASEIGTYVYCEEAWRLTHGLKIPPGSVRALRRGTETHAAWQRVERLTARLMRAALIVAALALAGILLRAYLS